MSYPPNFMLMKPTDYEHLVGEYFKKSGYHVTVTPASNDYGIDIFATKKDEKIAIQAKMYGESSRKINRQMIFELYGAAAYANCNKAIIATNGRVLDDAREVAEKLGIDILPIDAQKNFETTKKNAITDDTYTSSIESFTYKTDISHEETPGDETDAMFENLWEKYIMPLEGKRLSRPNGKGNDIVQVDWGGIKRITSNGRQQTIKIEIFRYAIKKLLTEGSVSRNDINQHYIGRASSGIVLILSQIPLFTLTASPSGQRLVLKKSSH